MTQLLMRIYIAAFVVTVLSISQDAILAAPPRVLPAGAVPADTRRGPLRGEPGDFLLTPAESPEAWSKRRDEVRQILRVALGLWPMPASVPLRPVIHGKIDGGEYTVEKVYFESLHG